MTTVAELVTRTQAWLMDEDERAFTRDQVRGQLAYTGARLAERDVCGAVVVVQAVASRAHYPLDAQAILLTSGTATGGSVTTLVDSGKDFVALGVVANQDRIRNLTDGSQAIVTAVATTTLTVAAFTGGIDNTPAASDTYLVETPLSHRLVAGVAQVYHNGQRLLRTTEQELDAKNDGWETWAAGTPRYWLQDSLVRPTEIRLAPAPSATGSGVPTFPLVPFALPITNNLVVFLTLDLQDLTGEDTPHGLPPAYEDLWVLDSTRALTTRQTDYENVALAHGLGLLSDVWRAALEGGR